MTGVSGLNLTVVRGVSNTLEIPSVATSPGVVNKRIVTPADDRGGSILPPDAPTPGIGTAALVAASPFGVFVPEARLIRGGATWILWQLRTEEEGERLFLTDWLTGFTRAVAITPGGIQAQRAAPLIPMATDALFDTGTDDKFVNALTLDFDATPPIEEEVSQTAVFLPLKPFPGGFPGIASLDWQGFLAITIVVVPPPDAPPPQAPPVPSPLPPPVTLHVSPLLLLPLAERGCAAQNGTF